MLLTSTWPPGAPPPPTGELLEIKRLPLIRVSVRCEPKPYKLMVFWPRAWPFAAVFPPISGVTPAITPGKSSTAVIALVIPRSLM